jgi:2-oxo-4-hydroxy-4-carboxy-5-ureidoimidazoline decarboxylase
MNRVLARWNSLDATAAAREALPCCGSLAWAVALATQRPIADEAQLIDISAAIWRSLPEPAWREAFGSHPRIGQKQSVSHATAKSLHWSSQEQQAVGADVSAQLALEEANLRYEQRFGHIFIVRASGKTSSEILTILEARMLNDDATELRETADQQRQITNIRLTKWLEGS